MLLGHIGIRADGLERYRPGVPVVGTALVYEFLYLDLGFYNWFGFCIRILGFLHFYVFGLVPKSSLPLAMNLVLLRTFYDWVFILSFPLLLLLCFGGTSCLGWICSNWVVIT